MRPWFPIAALLLIVAILIGQRIQPEAAPQLQVGRDLPEVQVVPLAGGDPRPLSEEILGVTVINVFASWCAPCRAEHPALTALSEEGVRIVGLAYRDPPADTQAFLAELGDPYIRVMADPTGAAGETLGLEAAMPQTLVVNGEGEVLLRHSGPLAGADGEAALAEIRRLTAAR